MTKNEFNKYKKMSPEELQMFLHFRKRGGKVAPKKGRGSYNRKNFQKGVA